MKRRMQMIMVLAIILTMILTFPVYAIERRVQNLDSTSERTVFIKDDNSLWSSGKTIGDDGRQLTNYEPVKIFDDVKAVSINSDHSIVIRTDGSLWAWGDFTGGSLGLLNEKGNSYNVFEPTFLMDNVAYISAWRDYSLAVKEDGTLWAWAIMSTDR